MPSIEAKIQVMERTRETVQQHGDIFKGLKDATLDFFSVQRNDHESFNFECACTLYSETLRGFDDVCTSYLAAQTGARTFYTEPKNASLDKLTKAIDCYLAGLRHIKAKQDAQALQAAIIHNKALKSLVDNL